ncbi:MAG: hypothetical protein GYB64_10975 [Chloroflexi bacterium]|nr:hypothetical protein [Chloroflexota bacterium]
MDLKRVHIDLLSQPADDKVRALIDSGQNVEGVEEITVEPRARRVLAAYDAARIGEEAVVKAIQEIFNGE